MRLKELIRTLEACDPDVPLYLGYKSTPDAFTAWRGDPRELSLTSRWVSDNNDGVDSATGLRSVGAVLAMARAADGAEFTGYKGGTETMSGDTQVWADEWGMHEGNILGGVIIYDDHVALTQIRPNVF